MNPIVSLIIANVIWGAASPIFKFSLTNIPPFTLAFIRFFFGALLFLPFLKFKDFRKLDWSSLWRIVIGLGLFGIFINISFFFLGLQRTESINAPVIASTGPVFLFLFSTFFLKEKVKINIFIGMMIALIGVLLIIFEPVLIGTGKNINVTQIEGNSYLLLATLAAVIHPLTIKKVAEKIDPLIINFIGFIVSSLFFLPLSLSELNKWSFASLNIAGWTGIIFGVIFSSTLAYFLYCRGLSKIKAQEVGIFTYIDPVAAVVIAIPLLSEYPNFLFLAGAALVLFGIYLAEKRIHYHPFKKIRFFR